MDLHVTLAGGPGVTLPEGRTTQEVVISIAGPATGEQIQEELADRTGHTRFFVDGQPLDALVPGTPPLVSGAVVVVVPEGQRMPARPRQGANLLFLVRTGPDAGRVVPLARGTYSIGRTAADIRIDDPELSRTHARLTVTNETVLLTDLDSANGVWVDGDRTGQAVITTSSDVLIGASRCALVLADTPQPAINAVDLSEPCEVSSPLPPEPGRLLLITAFLPLILGIVLAITTGMWFFLAFSALSAVTGVVPLVSARKKRAAFRAAVSKAADQDRERRRRAAHDIGSLALRSVQPQFAPDAVRRRPDGDRTRYLRVGVADQSANLGVKVAPTEWQQPVLESAPLLIPLSEAGNSSIERPVCVDIIGPSETLLRVAHLVVLQLCALDLSGGIICFGSSRNLPHAARFLPGVTLVTSREKLRETVKTARPSAFLIFDRQYEAAPAAGPIRTYRFFDEDAGSRLPNNSWVLDYTRTPPVLRTPGGETCFSPDLLALDTFTAVARLIGGRAVSASAAGADGTIPAAVELGQLTDSHPSAIRARWEVPSDGTQFAAVVGSSASGMLEIDLEAQGPHLLAAGTTGAGKSEFLRTLVLGVALHHSPAMVNFLFIDFKGGSGLSALSELPHSVGILTDLSSASVSRALTSLKAEVKRRERLFADAGAADYREYLRSGSTPALPRLVTVIDEFRMLAEEVPDAVQDLMRIAMLGRSLGMHLVLATQRPQGAVTSDIRANITNWIALRVQSAMESQDVLDSTVAAGIPVGLPGRGFLRVGAGMPVEFQTATASIGQGAPDVRVRPLSSYLEDPAGAGTHPSPGHKGGKGSAAGHLEGLISAIKDAAQEMLTGPQHLPLLPPLPHRLNRPDSGNSSLYLGILDLPHIQDQYPLRWDPERHSHLAFVGPPGSGLAEALTCTFSELLRVRPDTHLYVLDGDGTLAAWASAPQVGAYVTASEIKRAARVLDRVAEEVTRRLDRPVQGRRSVRPCLALLVSGWGRWSASFRSSRHGDSEDALQNIVRDGEAASVTVVIGGEKELASGRFFPMLPNRIFLPFGATSETLFTWPRLPAIDAVPGRAFVQGRISPSGDAVAQLVLDVGEEMEHSREPTFKPFQVAALPRAVSVETLHTAAEEIEPAAIPMGVAGDDLATAHLLLPQRTAAFVVGAARSGKSHTLNLIAQTAPPLLRRIRPAAGEDAVAFWRRFSTFGARGNELLLVDEADRLPRESHQLLAQLVSAGARAVFASSPAPALLSVSPLAGNLRTSPRGIVLGPRSPGDGDLFGVRLGVEDAPPPGRGVLIDSNGVREIQVANL